MNTITIKEFWLIFSLLTLSEQTSLSEIKTLFLVILKKQFYIEGIMEFEMAVLHGIAGYNDETSIKPCSTLEKYSKLKFLK